ncbi:hypothetical protein PBAL39_11160 [Pedobacter sp. BAL39]|nr:hypothetical protein PBAL39_11160 [Pedobacter sp. BAL39]
MKTRKLLVPASILTRTGNIMIMQNIVMIKALVIIMPQKVKKITAAKNK